MALVKGAATVADVMGVAAGVPTAAIGGIGVVIDKADVVAAVVFLFSNI